MSGQPGWTSVWRGNRLKAEIVGAALSAAGFRVSEIGGMTAYSGLDFDDCELFVPEAEARAARQLIEEAERPSGS